LTVSRKKSTSRFTREKTFTAVIATLWRGKLIVAVLAKMYAKEYQSAWNLRCPPPPIDEAAIGKRMLSTSVPVPITRSGATRFMRIAA